MRYQPPFKYGDTPGAPGIHNALPNAPYVNSDPALGVEGSYIPCEAIEHPQREILAVLAAVGVTPDHLVLDQLVESIARYSSLGTFGTGSGTANAHIVTALTGVVVPKAFFDGMIVEWVPAVTNTGVTTLAAWGLAAKNLKDRSGNALAGYDVVAGCPARARYVLGANEFRLIDADASRPAVPTTSGSSIDFTPIPAWARLIGIGLSGVSTSGTSNPLIQIGDSGGIENTGYLGAGVALQNAAAVGTTNYTTGFGVPSAAAANVLHGAIFLELMDAATNAWAVSGNLSMSNAAVVISLSGVKATSALLDRVRLTTVGGTDTFDAGSASIRFWR